MIQEQVLSHIILNHDSSIITLNNLTTDYFSDYKSEYNYITDFYNTYGKIPDKETFQNCFPDFTLIDVKEPTSYLIEALVEDKNKRFLATNYNKIRSLITENKIEEAMQLLRDASEKSGQSVSLQCVDLVHDTEQREQKYLDKLSNPDKYFIKTGFKELDDLISGWNKDEDLVTIVARNGLGKCLEKGTKVLMADGTIKCVEDIKVGDKVQSLNCVNTVLALHNGKSKGYRIIPKLGDPFTVSANHILTLMQRNRINKKGDIFHTTDNTFTMVDMLIEEYLALTPNQKRQYELYRPAINYPTKDLKIPPYILGLWLGEGTACRVSLTNTDPEIIDAWKTWGHQYTDVIRQDGITYDITNPANKGKKSEVLDLFREYDLLNNKHIPLDYLTSDREQRLELLAGILDTDGYLGVKHREKSNTTNCFYSICLKSRTLIEQIAQLARGLNFRVGKIAERKINNKVHGLTSYYTINISGKDISDVPCRLPHKKAISSTSQRSMNLIGFRVEEVPEIEYYGFMADGDHRYLLADNTLTHNTWILLKCASAAAMQGKKVGIYSGEMSEDSVGYRIDTLIGHISNGALVHGGGSVKNQYKDFLKELPEKVPGSLYVLTPKMINGSAGVGALRAFIEKYDLDILFVDQHSLLVDDRHGRTPVEKAANISTDLKNLQTTKRIPIVTVCQQNREKLEDGKTFDTTQLAQSDKIGQDSSLIIFIERKDDLVKLHLVKSRESTANKVLAYRTDFNLGNFTFVPEDNATPQQVQDSGYSEDEVF